MESDTLKIISLNIEYDNHFDRVLPFLKEHKPDVILLQEMLEPDIPFFEATLGMKSVFSGLHFFIHKGSDPVLGLATFSALPMTSYSAYYRGNPNTLPTLEKNSPEEMARSILVTQINKNNKLFRLINTHFTWSPNAKPNQSQYKDLKVFFELLSPLSEFIMAGDFNAPRGSPIFDAIAARYKDNIPPHITTTIDKNLHKAGDLNIVIDGLFTTPQYSVETIQLFDGMSDHWGIVAEISKR